MGSNSYEVIGSREDVEATIGMMSDRLNNGLNWPSFDDIEDLGDGRFRARCRLRSRPP